MKTIISAAVATCLMLGALIIGAFVQEISPANAQTMTGLTSVTTPAAVNNLVAKAAPGTQLRAYATNMTSTAGFLIGYNAVSAPADGALTGSLVIECRPLPASGTVEINELPGSGTNYNVGIVYILSSAANCWTKTTGTITGFIYAKVQ